MLRSFNRLFTVLALAITSLSLASHASAQSKAHHATGVAQLALESGDFTGSGQATHLGRYTEIGHVTLTPTSTPGVMSVAGWTHYTAANGDVLHADITGTVNVLTGAVTATATYVAGGSGRFANASGSSALTGLLLLPSGALTITAAGSISY